MIKKIGYVLLLSLWISAVYAEQLDLTVKDKDLDIPLEGVRIINTETGDSVFSDSEGNAALFVSESVERVVIFAELIGYTGRKMLIRDFYEPIVIEMMMDGILEGAELLVEAEAIGQTDNEIGVSTVIETNIIESSAKMGIIEDVMSAVAILPGVSYNGGFGAYLSVRGSAPGEMTAVMDGFVVQYPYHWGGGYSIFNPNIVESVKFSPGIFSSRYGQASGGLLEITTKTPGDGLKFSYVTSLSTLEAFLEFPLGANNEFGFFGGFRLTNYDIIFEFARSTMEEQGITFSRIPYIYDGYLKTFYRPSDNFEWYLNGFWGNDGIGIQAVDSEVDLDSEVSSLYNFKYSNIDLFFNTGVKYLASDNFLIHVLGGYEYLDSRVDEGIFSDQGTQFYSDEFKALYTPAADFVEFDLTSTFYNTVLLQCVQGRIDTDLTIGDNLVWQNGIGALTDFTSYSTSGNYYYFDYSTSPPLYLLAEFNLDTDKTLLINSFAYTNFNWQLIPDILSVDAGFRLDHSYFYKDEDFSLNTYPVSGPRMNLTWTPEFNTDFFRKNSFSLGSGLFSKTPFETLTLTEDMGIKDFDILVPKTFLTVLGWEVLLPSNFRFKIEGYYKYIFDRTYFYTVTDPINFDTEYVLYNDGEGYAGGFDFMLDRRTSRYLDGMISYSYIYARYRNPIPHPEPVNTDPEINAEWFYPDWQRFHTLNLMFDFKPFQWMTLTTKMSFASGTPRVKYGDSQMFPALVDNGDGTTSLIEMYTRETFYSDALRTGISLPLDFKLTFHNFYKNSRWRWEAYIAAEDVLSALLAKYSAKDNISTDQYTGKETKAPSSGFSFTMLSVGMKISY